jgi:hypothetical protein
VIQTAPERRADLTSKHRLEELSTQFPSSLCLFREEAPGAPPPTPELEDEKIEAVLREREREGAGRLARGDRSTRAT